MVETNTIVTEKSFPRKSTWWPLLLGPVAVAAVAIASQLEWNFDRLDIFLEDIAPFLIAAATAVYWIRAIFTRNPLYIVLTGLTASLLCREIHFDGMDRAIFVLLAVVGVWVLAWWDILKTPLKRDWRHSSWLIATLATYLLSQLIAKRVFKFVPGERDIHSKIEEGVETMSHLMMICTALMGSWRSYRSGGQKL